MFMSDSGLGKRSDSLIDALHLQGLQEVTAHKNIQILI